MVLPIYVSSEGSASERSLFSPMNGRKVLLETLDLAFRISECKEYKKEKEKELEEELRRK